ncbi:hypothetical protein AB6735_03750 [Mucilaginibacter sp. RCC_168]|uniref:hypothetical protein n=1 Tax=Mucilaginibacter sp. RCC_168 TaxID=3239221 RepID=UPI003525D0AA
MDNFKLIGIRPRKGCHTNLLKNLSGEQLYSFFSSYKFYNAEADVIVRTEGEIAYHTYESKLPDNLFDIDAGTESQPVKFNLSAIAGKNGSGKSTLIELFFAAVFVLAHKANIMTPTEIETLYDVNELEKTLKENKQRSDKLIQDKDEYISKIKEALAKEPDKIIFSEIEKAVLEQKRREDMLTDEVKSTTEELNGEKAKLQEYIRMTERTKVDILFKVDKEVYILQINPDQDARVVPIPTEKEFLNNEVKPSKKLDLQNISELFCYTIAVNYSHYSLNSLNLGNWINLLFHKNDGYQTPLVITPMRNEGNFDINDELGFAKARLLNNVMLQWNRNPEEEVELVENQNVTEVVFRLNKSKINNFPKYVAFVKGELDGDPRAVEMLRDYFKIALPKYQNLKFRDFPLKEKILNYIVKKIDKMSEHYPGFSPAYIYPGSSQEDKNTTLLNKIYNDTTHVTYKLHQAIHFLQYCIDADKGDDFYIEWGDMKGNKKIEFSFTLDKLFNWMGEPSEDELIRYLPPSLFEIDFKVSNSKGHSYRFNGLSSGEQQFVHTIQAVIYHLNNIQSAHANNDRIRYQAVNIILDEIELYFHPDFQRGFISKLLRAIARVNPKDERRIAAVNLLFLTHSPFILSDIPNENVLRLQLLKGKGKTYPYTFNDKDNRGEETFAANIYDLLANSFFIDGSAVGKFAEDKINAVIDKVNQKEQLTADDEKLIKLIGDKFLRFSIEEFTEKKGVQQ